MAMRVVREKKSLLAMTARAAAKAPVQSALASMKALVFASVVARTAHEHAGKTLDTLPQMQ